MAPPLDKSSSTEIAPRPRIVVSDADVSAAIEDHLAFYPLEKRPVQEPHARTPFFEGIVRLTLEMPPKTEAQRKQSELICRLAGALEDMSEMLPSTHPLLDEALGWKDRPDFEELLDAWEAGRHPVQQFRG